MHKPAGVLSNDEGALQTAFSPEVHEQALPLAHCPSSNFTLGRGGVQGRMVQQVVELAHRRVMLLHIAEGRNVPDLD